MITSPKILPLLSFAGFPPPQAAAAAFLLVVASSSILPAATLSTPTYTQPVAGGVIPSSVINYAVWDPRSGTEVTSIAPTATKSGGIGTISNISNAAGSGNVRGTTNTDPYTVSNPANTLSYGAVTNATVVGVFAPSFTPSQGVTLSLTNLAQLAGGQTYRINLWGSSFETSSTLNLSTDLGTTLATVSTPAVTGVKPLTRWTFDYNPDDTSEVLNIALISGTTGSGNFHTVIQAIDISIVPEPGSAVLFFGAAAAFMLKRRRC